MSGILCPKSTILEKLARIFYIIREDFPGNGALPESVIELLNDDELLVWYTGMAELKFVPFLPMPKEEEPQPQHPALNIKLPGTYQPDWSPFNLTPEQINDAICVTGRRGYQMFAVPENPGPGNYQIASYTEAESVREALHRCVQQFPWDEGYSGHGVKDIETQKETLLSELSPPGESPENPVSDAGIPPRTGFPSQSEPEPLSLILEPPALSLD